MVYVKLCPKCQQTVTFFENEDSKVCRSCNEVVFNTNNTNKKEEDASRQDNTGDGPVRRKRKPS